MVRSNSGKYSQFRYITQGIKEINFQKRKTCRNGVDCPAQMGLVVEGLIQWSPKVLFNNASITVFENARTVGKECCSNRVVKPDVKSIWLG